MEVRYKTSNGNVQSSQPVATTQEFATFVPAQEYRDCRSMPYLRPGALGTRDGIAMDGNGCCDSSARDIESCNVDSPLSELAGLKR